MQQTETTTTIAAHLGMPPFAGFVQSEGAATRAALRTWAMRCGAPKRDVMGAGMQTLIDAYAVPAKLAALIASDSDTARAKGEAEASRPYAPKREADAPPPRPMPGPLGAAANAQPQPQPIAAATGDAADKIREALAIIAGATRTPLDESRVIDLIREHANTPRGITLTVSDASKGAAVDLGRVHRQQAQLIAACGARLANGTRLNVFLSGPAGSGKTTAAEKVAEALGLPFYFNGAIDSEYKLLGFTDANGRIVSRPFRQAYENGGVYLFDEVDASLPSAVLAFNAALANGVCDFPDGMIRRHPDCIIIAAGNTFLGGATTEYVGRFKQDAAFADRFAAIHWTYDEDLETATSGNEGWADYVQGARRRAATKGLKVIISPRATYHGAALLAAGMDRETVEAMTIRKGMTDDQWRSLWA